MRIDFKDAREESIDAFMGGKGSFGLKKIDGKDVAFLLGRLEPGASVGFHKHLTDSEELIVLSGSGKVVCDGETERLSVGVCHYCPRGSSHAIYNDGAEELVFFAVTPRQI